MTKEELANLVRFIPMEKEFTVCFMKRTSQELRCMVGIKTKKHLKGGDRPYDFETKDLVCVWDKEVGEYRTIPLEGILQVNVDGEEFILDEQVQAFSSLFSRVLIDRYQYIDRIKNPRWEDLRPEIQAQLDEKQITAIERHYVMVFGKETCRIHVWILGSRKPQIFNNSGRRLN